MEISPRFFPSLLRNSGKFSGTFSGTHLVRFRPGFFIGFSYNSFENFSDFFRNFPGFPSKMYKGFYLRFLRGFLLILLGISSLIALELL